MSDEADDHSAFQAADLESTLGDEPLAEKESTRLFTYCGIRVHCKRKRLADPDGLSIKAILDGLTKAGVFADDNAKCIKEVRFTQAQSSEEETIIEIFEEA